MGYGTPNFRYNCITFIHTFHAILDHCDISNTKYGIFLLLFRNSFSVISFRYTFWNTYGWICWSDFYVFFNFSFSFFHNRIYKKENLA